MTYGRLMRRFRSGARPPHPHSSCPHSLSAGNKLIGFYDYGSTVNLNVTDTFTVDVDDTNGVLTIV